MGKKDIAILFSLFVFFVYKIASRYPTFSDSIFYMSVNSKFVNGQIPYKDFFFAHPAFQFYIMSFLGTFQNYSLFYFFTVLIQSTIFLLTYKLLNQFKINKIYLVSFVFCILFFVFIGHYNGYFISLVLFLISFNLILRGKYSNASVFYTLSILTRFYSVFYFPILLLFSRNRLKFVKHLIFYLSFFVLVFLFIFGHKLIVDTLIFEFNAKLLYEYPLYGYTQIITFYPFYILLSMVAIMLGREDKNIKFSLIYVILIDLLVIFFFRGIVYHYFLFSIFLMNMFSIVLLGKKSNNIIKNLPFLVVLLVLILNTKTIFFYTSNFFVEIAKKIHENVDFGLFPVFGEPVMLNYLNYTYNITVFSDEYDTYYQHLIFDENFVKKIREEKPRYIIDLNNYYMGFDKLREMFLNDYHLIYSIEKNGFRYDVYEKK